MVILRCIGILVIYIVFKKLLFTLYFVLNLVFSYGQDENYVFKHLSETQGLNHNVVNCIYKSPNGKMWIATYHGFNSFDGANFVSYKMRKGNNTMPNEVVHELCEDKQGLLWGATNNGVFSYNIELDQYTAYKLKSANSSVNFFNILCDKNGVIWATGTWSLFKYDRQRNTFEEKLKFNHTKDTSQYCFVTKNGLVEEPASNKLWITTGYGIWYYDYKSNLVGNARTEKNNPLFDIRNTAALYKSDDGKFWFFDNNTKNIIQFDPIQKKEIQHIYIGKAMPTAKGATLFEDKQHRLWFSSWTYEILQIDLSNKNSIISIKHSANDNRSIAGNFFWSAYQDVNNTIWFGTVAGISFCNPKNAIYKEYRLSNYINEFRNTTIQLVEQDPNDSSYWILNNKGILFHFNKLQPTLYKKYPLVDAIRNGKGLLPGNCSALKFIENHVVLTTSNGTWQINRHQPKLMPYTLLPKGYSDFLVTELIEDGDSVMYFNDGKQILYWNKLNAHAQIFYYKVKDTSATFYGMCLTPNHKVWLMTRDKQLVTLEQGSLNIRNLKRDFEKETGIFWSMVPDSNNNLWILHRGTGIYYYNTKTQEIKLWDITDGLPGNRMQEIALDKTGKVWMMIANKIAILNPQNSELNNFIIDYSTDNLDYDNHLSRLANGNILGTISDELIEFFPDHLLMKPIPEKPIISQFIVKEKVHAIKEGNTILLNTDENTIRISFGSFIDKTIFPYEFEYTLGGNNREWQSTNGLSEIMFTNLPPSDYLLKIRVKGKINAWVSDQVLVQFTIKTPFFKSPWFLLFLCLLLSAAIYSLYKYRLNQKDKMLVLQSKTQLLEKEKAMVMYENLKEHLNPHFLFNSLTSLRSLIRLDQNMAGDFLDKMSKVYRYILKNRENETVLVSEEMKFVQLYIDLQKTRFEKGLSVSMNIVEEYQHRKIAPVTLQNLVENAIKHNTAEEDAPLIIELLIEEDYLVVRNNLQKKNFVETSNKQGLANMESLYKYLSNKPMLIMEDKTHFTVKIPLI